MSSLDQLQSLLSHPSVADVVMYRPSEDEQDFRAHVFLLTGKTLNIVAPNVSELISLAYKEVTNSLELN